MADPKQDRPIVQILLDNTMPLKELQGKASALAIGAAWAAGDIEFGHREYVISGPAGATGSALIVEEGMTWTGEKSARHHKPYKELVADDLPACEKYLRTDLPRVMAKDQATGVEYSVMAPCKSQQEAYDLIALQVRLTDKGQAKLNAPQLAAA